VTDFDRVSAYYDVFDEWGRLEAPEGKLEFDMCLPVITGFLPEHAEILDLGGGPGRYTIALARLGYGLRLADLSQTLLDQAQKRIAELGLTNVKSIAKVNATDLSGYEDEAFDAVLVFGPLYHLTGEGERLSCVREVHRVLKKNGLVFASFIPYLSGGVGIAWRMFHCPDQADIGTVERVFSDGVFNNNANRGFQEAYFPTSGEIESLFGENGFAKRLTRSIRGWGSRLEEEIYRLKAENPGAYEDVIALINRSAADPSIIEMCSHAIYVGEKT